MLIIRHDTQNGFVLPEARWALYVEGLITQHHHSKTDIEVTVGSEYPLIVLQQFVKNGAISVSDIVVYDEGIQSDVPLDADGCYTRHSTIGEDRMQLLYTLF